MGISSSSAVRTLTLVAAVAFFVPGSAFAVEHQVDILLDLDDDATTGCTVVTVDGPFDGVEQILVTTVDTTSPPPAGTVTDVAIRDCTDPGTDTFGAPASSDGGWPIGVDNGVGGRDVVETYFPLLSSVVADPGVIRLGVVVTDELGGEQALLTVDDDPAGAPIVIDLRSVVEIPTLGEWGLILLALTLAAASVLLLGRRGTVAFGAALLLLATGTAWAAGGLDGLTGDWSTSDQLASNGIVFFGKAAGGDLCFRVDVDLLFNTSPTADPQAVSTDEETPVAITLTGSDPESDPLTFTIVSGPTHGTLSGAPPNVTYTPDLDYEGPDSFEFQVEDPSAATDTATVTITVNGVNDAPVAQDDAFTTGEDTQLVGDVLADNGSGTDSDLDGDTLSVNTTPISAPTDGTLVLDADGTFTYDPDPNFNGSDSFEYEVSDGNGGTDVGLVTISVASVNDPPVAQDDAFSTDEDMQLSGGNVLADNGSGADSDDDGDPLTVNTTPVSAPTNGTLVLNADGTFTYDPSPDFHGADSFEYQVSDGNGGTDVGLVSITINPLNDDPTAVDDNFLVSEDSLDNALDVLANDDDAPDTGETLTVTGVGAPDQGGSVAVNGTNDGLVYSPAPNFVGNETFTYDIADGNGGTATATVTVAVSAINDAPVVDLDADDSGGTVGTGYAVAYAENDGPVAAVDATDATITDVDSASLDSVIITLQNLLDAGEESLAAISGDPDITVEPYDTTTVPGEGILRLTTTSPQPIADFVAVLRTVTYEHTGEDPDTSNPRTIAFVADDGMDAGPAAISTVTITAANDPPVAQDDAYTTPEDTQLVAGSVLDDNGSGPDTDSEGDSLTVNTTPVSGPSNGTLTLAADGTFTYDPDLDFEGLDTFEYEVSDGNGGTDTATVSISVTAVNDPPVAQNDAFTTDEDVQLAGNVLVDNGSGIDDDADGDTLTVNTTPVTAPTDGTLVLNANGTFTYDPDPNFNGSDSFVYQISDGNGGTDTATVSISVTAVNDPPVAQNDAFTTDEDVQLAGNVLVDNGSGIDDDADGDTLTVNTTPVTAPTDGTLVLNANGTFTYDPDPNFNGSDSFVYQVSDGNGGTDTATVSISVTAVNDLPVAQDDAFTTAEDTQLSGGNVLVDNGSGPDDDLDGDTLTVNTTPVSAPSDGTLVLNANGTFTYDPDLNFNGSDSFTYEVSDGNGGTDTAMVTITVTAVDDPPVAVDDLVTVDEDSGANTLNVQGNDSDVDGGPKAVQAIVTSPSNGTATVVSGNAVYTPNANYCNGDAAPSASPDTFEYSLNGGDVGLVSVTVICINDPPVAGADAFDFIGNTELRVDHGAAATPHALETTTGGTGLLENDSDPVENDPISIVGLTVGACTDNSAPFDCSDPAVGRVQLDADGSFSFQPAPGDAGVSESFQYTLSDGTDTTDGSVTLTRFERVWYVDNSASPGGDGTSDQPLHAITAANLNDNDSDGDLIDDADAAGDYIFVHFGLGTDANLSGGLFLEGGQHLIGEHAGLSLPVNLNGNGSPTLLVAAAPGSRPMLDDNVADGFDGVVARNVVPAEIVGMNLAGDVNAIDWTTTSAFAGAGTFSIRDNVIRSAGGEGVDVNLAGTGATSLAFHDNNLTATGTALDLQESGSGTVTITRFDDNVVSGNTGGHGIAVNGAIFDAVPGGAFDLVSGGTTAIGASGNGVGFSGLLMTGVSGDLQFTDLDVFADNGTGLQVGGTGPSNLAGATGMRFRVGAGVGIVTATAGPAVYLSNVTADLQLSSLTSSSTSSIGVNLDGVSDGGGTNAVFSAGSGSSITTTAGASGPAFRVNGGNARITYPGTITNNSSSARAVSITSWAGDDAGDDLLLSGAIDENGAGILLNGNGGSRAITFSGGLDIDTTAGEGFAATSNTNALGLNVTGSGNTIDTVSATGLRVTSTPIGSGNLNFQRISSGNNTAAADPANGIVVSNTGSLGRLVVTGTGGAGTGGTIQSTTGTGIALTNTANASFSHMQISNTGSHGLSGSGMVDGTGGGTPTLSILNSRFTSPGDGDNESAMYFGNTAVPGNNAGRIVVADTVVEQFEESGFELVNSSGSLTIDITGSPSGLTDSTTKFDDNNDTHGQHAITVVAQGTASIDLNVTGVYMNNIEAEGVVVQSTAATSSVNVDLLNNVSINGGGPDNFPSGGGIALIQNAGGSMTFDVQGNNIRDLQGDGVVVIADGPSEGRIGGSGAGEGNVISGSLVGDGIRIDTDQLPGNGNNFTATILIQGNNIGNDATFPGIGDDGIQILNRDGTKTLNLTIENNQIANTGSEAIRYFTDADTSDGALRPSNAVRVAGNTFSAIGVSDATYYVTQDTAQMCLHMSGNTFVGANHNISVNQQGSSQFQITQASVAGLAAANTGSTASSTGTIDTGGTCTNPPLPTNP